MTASGFGLYIHIPFCSQKCPYCDFNTYAVSRIPEPEYVQGLLAELSLYARHSSFNGRKIKTVFFGGGTPSLLSPGAIKTVLEKADSLFPFETDIEITLEANPASAMEEKYRAFRAAGINRLSLGAQSFSPKNLELLGRDHTRGQIRGAVEAAARVGLENVSLDIIFGLPGQAVVEVLEDLNEAIELPIKHISTYSLTIEKGTPFFQRQERGLLQLPPDETVVTMLDQIPKFLSQHGFSRYEISNYAREGSQSKHNLAYWNGDDYLGLGAGAHSFVVNSSQALRSEALRWSNCALPTDYMSRIKSGSAISWKEQLDLKALRFEFYFLGLRRIAGVDLGEFETNFGAGEVERYKSVISELISERYLTSEENRIALSRKGIMLADSIVERFLVAE